MSIFSIFTLKSDINKVFSTQNITNLKTYIAQQIVSYVNNNDLLGPQKKEAVDKAIVSYIKTNFKTSNTYVNVLVDVLVMLEPNISQFVYDDLQKFVNGLTVTAQS